MMKLARFAHAREGNVAAIFAMVAPLITILMAIAIDLGAVSNQRREMQSVSDLAAIIASAEPEKATELALAFLSDNGHTDVQVVKGGIDRDMIDLTRPAKVWVEVTPGQYVPDAERKPAERFVAGERPYNAVKVTAAQPGRFFIMSGVIDPPVIETTGVAHASGEAAFSVGSRLVRVEDGVLNGLLNSLIGSDLTLNVMDYNALLTSDVSLFGTLDALAGEINLSAARYDDVLDADISVAQLALAARQSGMLSVQLRSALQKIANDPASARRIMRLRDAIDLGAAGRFGPADAGKVPAMQVGAMELLTGTLTAANGEHQVTLDLGASVPGLLKTTVELRIGERPQKSPWLRLSGPDQIVSTAQTRLKIEAEVPGLALLAGSSIRVPLYVEAAAADARLTDVNCTTGRIEQTRVQVAAQPAVGQVMLGDVSKADFAKLGKTLQVKPAHIVDTPLIDVTGKANVRVGNLKPTELSFSYADILKGNVKTATTKDYTASLLASVLDDLDLTIKTGPLSLATPKLITAALGASLTPAVEPVDSVAFSLLSALGVHLGEADVRVHGVMCQRPVLVQ